MEPLDSLALALPEFRKIRKDALRRGALDPMGLRYRILEYDRSGGGLIGIRAGDLGFREAVEKTAGLDRNKFRFSFLYGAGGLPAVAVCFIAAARTLRQPIRAAAAEKAISGYTTPICGVPRILAESRPETVIWPLCPLGGRSCKPHGEQFLLPQDSVAADGITKDAAQEHVRDKMSGKRDPRKPNQCSHAVRCIWNPAMIAVSAGGHGSNRKRRYGVTGGETPNTP